MRTYYKRFCPQFKSRYRIFCFVLSGLILLATASYTYAEVVNVPKDFKTIQDAVDSAALGDTILVAPGLYVENIYITKKLSLQSTDGYKSTVIQAKMPAASVITIEKVGGVLITGFTVKGSLNSGIHLRRVTDSTITGNYLTKNMMGIYLEHSSKNDIKKNISTKNAEGINLYYSFRNNIIANEAYSNSEKGIVLYTSNANRLISNEANSNVWDGITIWNSKRNHLRSNVAVGNTYAIVTDNEENDIFDNRTMRRLYYVLPIVLIYLALVLYNLEKKLFRYIYKVKPKGIGPKKWHRL